MTKKRQERPTRQAIPRPEQEQDVVSQPAPRAEAPSPPARPPGRVESWPIAKLKPHHRQAAMFHDVEGPASDEFVADIARHGIREPIPVTPDGVMIGGHRRKWAAERLGWTEVPVRIRDDLAGEPAAIERAHIEDNKHRRHLDPVDQARVEKRLAGLDLGREPGRLDAGQLNWLVGRVAERIGCSLRHARRLLNISGTAMPVQKALAAGRITLVDADRVSRLDARIQRKIAEEIEAGGNAAEIVARHLPRPARKVKPSDAYERLVCDLVRSLDALEGRAEDIRRPTSRIRADLEVFERLDRFREIVVPMLERQLEESERAFAELMAEFGRGDITDDVESAVA